jgi:hypothetical protein
MTLTLSYKCNGRLGNNILQFIAAFILSTRLGRSLTPPGPRDTYVHVPPNTFKVSDDDWDEWMRDKQLSAKQLKKLVDAHEHVFLDGYFQRGDVLLRYKQLLIDVMRSSFLFVPDLEFKQLFVQIPVPADIGVIHLRLSDFNFQGTTNVVDPQFYIDEINKARTTHNIQKFLIVVDKLHMQGEKNYVDLLVKSCKDVQFMFHSSSILNDWNVLRCAPYVISSNSSFAFTACLYGMIYLTDVAGSVKRVVYPLTGFYPHQTFGVEMENWTNVDVKKIDYTTL